VSAVTRATGGRFAPGACGNVCGRPSKARLLIEADLLRLGATRQEIDGLLKASGNRTAAAVALAVLCAVVAERREQLNAPSPVMTQPEGSPTR
jgi:hypothetical protein